MIKALVFDCFGVFYVDPVFAYMREPTTLPEKARALHDLDIQAAYGLLDKPGFIKQASTLLARSPAEIEEQFFRGHVRNKQLVAFAEQARKHYKVALLSNIGSDMMDGFFSIAERQSLFDTVVISGEVGLAKPDPAIFRLTCEQLGVTVNEAVMIDDMPGNVTAAEQLGMHGICYTDFVQFKQELDALLAH